MAYLKVVKFMGHFDIDLKLELSTSKMLYLGSASFCGQFRFLKRFNLYMYIQTVHRFNIERINQRDLESCIYYLSVHKKTFRV